MPKAISLDLRERAVAVYEAGGVSLQEVAERFQIGSATMKRLIWLKRETGSLQPRPRGKKFKPAIHGEVLETLRELVEANNDATRAELGRLLGERTGIYQSVATIGRALKRLGYTRKKRPRSPWSATGKTS